MKSIDSHPANKTALYDNIFSDYRLHIALLIIFSIVLIFSKLAGNGLANYDDCYYAQKAKEILQTKSWMTMHMNGLPSFDNSPFFLWLVALSYMVFGVGEYAAKFPSALMGVSAILLIYFFARRLFNSWTGFFSSLVLSTTFIFTRYAKHAMMDVTLSFFVCLALFALVLSLRKNGRYFFLWGLSISICILIKSVLGLFPFVITVLYLLATRRWRTFFNGYFLAGCAIVVLLGFSWYFHQYLHFGHSFLDSHFGWLILRRGFLSEPEPWHRHLSYLKVVLINYWPWFPFMAIGLWSFLKMAWKRDENAILLLLWPITILATMSIMRTRVRWYILPIFPGLAIISGYALNRLLTDKGKLIFTKISFGLVVLAMILINATPLQVSSERNRDVRVIAPYVRYFGDDDVDIIAFRQVYHRLNNALIFYSDYAASPIYQDYAELSERFEDPALVLCIMSPSELEAVTENVPGVHVVRRTDKLVLLSNRPVDVSAVKTW